MDNNFQQQMNLQQIANQKKQMAAPITEKMLNEQMFPTESISEWWIETMQKACMHCSPMSQRATVKEFAAAISKMHSNPRGLSLAQFQIIANTLDVVTPTQMGIDISDYQLLVDETMTMVNTWSNLVSKINEAAMIEVERVWKVNELAKKRGDEAVAKLKPVVGQA